MNKTIIVSNRLPVQIKMSNGKIHTTPSVGGLATGMKSIHQEGNGLWVGWSGLTENEVPSNLKPTVDEELSGHNCVSVNLNKEDIDHYYYGFSNRALWPLFHYFTEYTEFDQKDWEVYQRVNEKFADVVLDNLNDGDTVWVHDYQLLLLPQLIRNGNKKVSIGFFLHIPFPSFEIFRTFPARESLLHGMLGADLIGFHTYNYERHFLSSVKRILGYDASFNEISYKNRIVRADSFPMSIDYDKFHGSAQEHKQQTEEEKSELQQHLDFHTHTSNDSKLILSIDRLDYTKGIANRIRGYELFLEKYPQYKNKVQLIMLAVPSRSNVPQYQRLKKEIDELVGRINGKYSTVSWTPVRYFYRSMPFQNLIDLYTSAHIALVTPVRDGMNLVAKEYIATRTEGTGVLILSEMAGASHELNEAILINPNHTEEIADAIKTAFEMPVSEQKKRMKFMQKRLKRYGVEKWAQEFMKTLKEASKEDETIQATRLNLSLQEKILSEYKQSNNALLLLDYDGTLAGFEDDPKDAAPSEDLFGLLDQLTDKSNTTLCLISGRDKQTFSDWFQNKKYNLITDHGIWIRDTKYDWKKLESVSVEWTEKIRPILSRFVDRTPGTFIEKKKYSLAWHYRKADPELAQRRKNELETVLNSLIKNNNISLLKGNKVMEIKSSNVNKGRAANRFIQDQPSNFDFIFCVGDDWTDEYMFEALPEYAHTVKVGLKQTAAKYRLSGVEKVHQFLTKLARS